MSLPRRLRTHRLASLAVSSAVLVTAAACGGSSSPSASTPTQGTAPSGAPTPAQPKQTGTAAAKTVKPVPVESNPPGDIPDNLAFVTYANRPGHYAFTHPEGWVQTGNGTQVRFTDKLNGVTVDSSPANQAPTVASARSTQVPALQARIPAFQLRSISAVKLPAGSGVNIVFRRNSDPDPVTGKVYRDEVQEYLVLGSGRLVTMDLYGPVGADNVDAYRTMSQSLRIK
jgi:hypothetical protein